MPRRKYRLFTLCSVIVLFLLYRVARNSWEEPPGFSNLQPPAFPLDSEADPESNIERPKPLPEGVDPPVVPVEDFAKVEVPDLKEQDEPAPVDRLALQKEEQEQQQEASTKGSGPQAGSDTQVEPQQPEVPAEKVHWVKQPENFPLAEDKITKLPSGTPKKIPKIQFEFAPETAEAKARREIRLQNITGEIERSWGAYRKYAWMHDELSPVTGESRDPFCGWAATLVDSLDTLWIAGLTEAFDDAATAVADIDFTWSTRRDIPVFETTIRYLGGLLAAYDVSGGAAGKYKILLDKAIELAEVLMGVFDTPNRMPDLYYKWEPQYASQPRRASQVGIAELGTLSMEFTRLAQLTGSHKYYDAINRITDALIEMQKSRHVSIPGLFPQGIDASGCKRIMRPDPKAMSDAAQSQLTQNKDLGAPVGYTGDEDIITPAGHAPIDDERELLADQDPRLQKRGTDTELKDGWVAEGVQPRKRPPYNAKGEGVDWDCEPQALVPDSYAGYYYSMGGSQDSAYEYFPKVCTLNNVSEAAIDM
jgi:mannosyl-oligosaccharide alpha-1,2-mannosidase